MGALALLVVACSPGAYTVDIFPEMHYQASQRRLEPERLAPPSGAVPVSGGRPAYNFEQATSLENPVPRDPQTLERARQVFQVNCAMCHGRDGRGQSVVAEHFVRANVVPPVDFAGDRARGRTDGQLYWIVANGLGNMPPFGELLSEAELWTVVHFIREVQGQ
jgi:mono/diheme cytochrome c family protein